MNPMWLAARATGEVSLLLLTTVTVLGIITAGGWAHRRWPRTVTTGLHRNVSLLSVVFLAVHIGTTVIDSYVTVDLWDAIVPFGSHYQPLWLGLGAVAVDLTVALVVTSLLRDRMSPRAWRGVHWAAYACWMVAVIHSIGVGSDRLLTLGLGLACAFAVSAAALVRFGLVREDVYA